MFCRKTRLFLFVLALLGLNQGVIGNDIKIKGEVLAYQLSYTAESDKIAPKFGSFIPIPSTLLVKVKKLYKGESHSELVIIKFYSFKKGIVPNSLISGKEWKFKLVRQADCDNTISGISTFNFIDEKGETVQKIPNITWVQQNNQNILDLNKTLLCYLIK